MLQTKDRVVTAVEIIRLLVVKENLRLYELHVHLRNIGYSTEEIAVALKILIKSGELEISDTTSWKVL